MKGCLKLSSFPGSSSTTTTTTTTTSSSYTSTSSSYSTSASFASSSSSSSSSSSTMPMPPKCGHRKCVAFGAAGSEEVFTADEWDRTPTEPARKLTYQDLLELKEIQRSLPRANQPYDAVTGRAGRHYLSAVPIGLLPLAESPPVVSGGGGESASKENPGRSGGHGALYGETTEGSGSGGRRLVGDGRWVGRTGGWLDRPDVDVDVDVSEGEGSDVEGAMKKNGDGDGGKVGGEDGSYFSYVPGEGDGLVRREGSGSGNGSNVSPAKMFAVRPARAPSIPVPTPSSTPTTSSTSNSTTSSTSTTPMTTPTRPTPSSIKPPFGGYGYGFGYTPRSGSGSASPLSPLSPISRSPLSPLSPTSSQQPSAATPYSSPYSSQPPTPYGSQPTSRATSPGPSHLAHLAHLVPPKPRAARVRPVFGFLPLLDSDAGVGAGVGEGKESKEEEGKEEVRKEGKEGKEEVTEVVVKEQLEDQGKDDAMAVKVDEVVKLKEANEVEKEKAAPGWSSPTVLSATPTPTDSAAASEVESEGYTDTDDTDVDCEHAGPPTPALTNASLESSPRSRASSLEPREREWGAFGRYHHAQHGHLHRHHYHTGHHGHGHGHGPHLHEHAHHEHHEEYVREEYVQHHERYVQHHEQYVQEHGRHAAYDDEHPDRKMPQYGAKTRARSVEGVGRFVGDEERSERAGRRAASVSRERGVRGGGKGEVSPLAMFLPTPPVSASASASAPYSDSAAPARAPVRKAADEVPVSTCKVVEKKRNFIVVNGVEIDLDDD